MLEIAQLSVLYGKIRALTDVSLTAVPGEIVAVIGANGAGKTTLLRAIMGLVPCAAGSVRFAGEELARQPAHVRPHRGIGIVPEGRGLFVDFTVEENLMAGAYCRSDRREIQGDLEKIYALYPKLKERRRQLAGGLSGGEAQMLALGRALLGRPRLLLLDEPSMGLMPVVVNEIFATIGRLRAEGMSVLLVEQNAKKALKVADRVVVLQLGSVAAHGRPAEVLQDDRVRRAYFGGEAGAGGLASAAPEVVH
jgi:branched-chain amino acid transport system ATP-binding protein